MRVGLSAGRGGGEKGQHLSAHACAPPPPPTQAEGDKEVINPRVYDTQAGNRQLLHASMLAPAASPAASAPAAAGADGASNAALNSNGAYGGGTYGDGGCMSGPLPTPNIKSEGMPNPGRVRKENHSAGTRALEAVVESVKSMANGNTGSASIAAVLERMANNDVSSSTALATMAAAQRMEAESGRMEAETGRMKAQTGRMEASFAASFKMFEAGIMTKEELLAAKARLFPVDTA